LSTKAQTFVNLESGAFFTDINDIRNGNNGTLFSLKNDFQTPVSPFYRLRAGYLSNGKNHFSFLYAPLKIVETATIEKDILFEGKNFKANVPIEVVYKFNSYRFTYNRRIISKDNFKFGLGLSAKIRDAGVSLKNRELLSENFSIGFAPLINLIANWDISQKIGVDFFGEGMLQVKEEQLTFHYLEDTVSLKTYKETLAIDCLKVEQTERIDIILFNFILYLLV
jgi:hypothetical protein